MHHVKWTSNSSHHSEKNCTHVLTLQSLWSGRRSLSSSSVCTPIHTQTVTSSIFTANDNPPSSAREDRQRGVGGRLLCHSLSIVSRYSMSLEKSYRRTITQHQPTAHTEGSHLVEEFLWVILIYLCPLASGQPFFPIGIYLHLPPIHRDQFSIRRHIVVSITLSKQLTSERRGLGSMLCTIQGHLLVEVFCPHNTMDGLGRGVSDGAGGKALGRWLGLALVALTVSLYADIPTGTNHTPFT